MKLEGERQRQRSWRRAGQLSEGLEKNAEGDAHRVVLCLSSRRLFVPRCAPGPFPAPARARTWRPCIQSCRAQVRSSNEFVSPGGLSFDRVFAKRGPCLSYVSSVHVVIPYSR